MTAHRSLSLRHVRIGSAPAGILFALRMAARNRNKLTGRHQDQLVSKADEGECTPATGVTAP